MIMSCVGSTSAQVARYHMQRGVGFLSNQVGLLVPVEIVTDGNSEVLCLRDGTQDCPTHLIKLVQSAPPVYVRDVALGLKVIPQRTASCGDYQGPVEKLFGRSYSGFAVTRGTHLRRGGCRYLRRLVMAYHWYRSGKAVVWGPFLVELQRKQASAQSFLHPRQLTVILHPVRNGTNPAACAILDSIVS